MKKIELWNRCNETEFRVVYPEAVRDVLDFGYDIYVISGVPVEAEDALNKAFSKDEDEYEEHCWTDSFLKSFLLKNGYSDVEIEREDNPTANGLGFDANEHLFFNMGDSETVKMIEYWDGSNWQKVFRHDEYNNPEVEVEDAPADIDEWTGSNWQFGGVGNHAKVYKIATIDGEPVKDKYLFWWTSQLQGSYDTAEICDIERVQEILEERGHSNPKSVIESMKSYEFQE